MVASLSFHARWRAASKREPSSSETTFGEARKLGWRLTARGLPGTGDLRSGSKRRTIECKTSAELDMKTLVWTEG